MFMETSARTGGNVNIIFRRACEQIVRYTVSQVPATIDNGIQRGSLIEPVEFFRAQSENSDIPMMDTCCSLM